MTLIAVGLASIAAGCGSWQEEELEDLRWRSRTLVTKKDGYVRFELDVEPGETGMMIVAEIGEDQQGQGYDVFIDRVSDPAGVLQFDAQATWPEPRAISGGAIPAELVTFSWPALGSHTQLSPGKWLVEIGVLETADDDKRYLTSNVAVDLDVLVKQDPDFTVGELDIQIIYAGLGGDAEVQRATMAASDVWRDIYAGMGIDLAFSESDWEEGDLAAVGLGSEAEYEAIAAAFTGRHVNVVMTDTFEGISGLYGIAGGIPGPLVPTRKSAVAISATQNSGSDLVFDDDEVRLLGETIGHEVGHFVGLFHPVELNYETWDALGDTPECAGESECIDVLGDNMMFPFPMCNQWGCLPQQDVTTEQIEVTQRYTGVR
jgi:hypothetical protein